MMLQYGRLWLRGAVGLAISYWAISFYDWVIAIYHGKNITHCISLVSKCCPVEYYMNNTLPEKILAKYNS